ncbi:hypothetical protein JVT61DRAFT_14900 [Boletus reticuloceps]|uniref:DUF6830 domain-containing protein n=1 Tax=Boletus reticuloceps TaxID=495285 RepID=A0A8I2YCM0_9AGAM|nr:hypothetical protein JVT61DRAFT_14900 [Boletus reticuloceps]
MQLIDEFLSLQMVRSDMPLSFLTAKDLRARAELLPSGLRWQFQVIPTTHPTKKPVHLYYRDALECIESLFNHPFLADKMEFSPFRLFTTAEHLVRVYTEWMSSDSAWEMQSQIPEGGSLCGVILSSDKTHITNISGGKAAHPLLISLANIKIIVVQPLKKAAEVGPMMSDPLGNLRYCFTPLVSYIADTPEAGNFGDAHHHGPRTATVTLAQLQSIQCNPLMVEEYFAACEIFRLSGVSHPFWNDWPLAQPCQFLTSEGLHHWHGEFWDHDVKWCIHSLGAAEINFRFSLLPTITGLCQFPTGITKLKQVCGRTKRDIQRYIVVVIAGAADPDVVIAIRALMEFRYRAQAPAISSTGCDLIRASLQEFHDHKDAILEGGLRRDKLEGDNDSDDDDSQGYNENGNVLDDIWTPQRKSVDYFIVAAKPPAPSAPSPRRTFSIGPTAFRVNYDPSLRRVPIDDVARMFNLPDLRGALGDYVNREGNFARNFHHFGQRRCASDVHLLFSALHIWYKVRLQQKVYHDPSTTAPTFTIHAQPPDRSWAHGRYDSAIMKIDEQCVWPSSGLLGMIHD